MSSVSFSFIYNIPLSTLENVSTTETGTKPRCWTSVLTKSFCLSFCKSKWLGQRKQRKQHSKSKMYTLLHRNPTPETSCRGKCRPGLYLLNLDCVSSSGWIGQVHRARHIPQRTWSWNKWRGNRGRGLLSLLILLFSFHLPESSWMEADSIHAVARMRQQLSLGCSPSLLKGRYRVSNSSDWLDTIGSSKKRGGEPICFFRLHPNPQPLTTSKNLNE